MWCTLALIASQIVSVLLTAHYGVMVMVAIYTLLTVLWLLAWHWFAHRLIGLRLLDVLRDLLPFCLLSLAVMAVTYWVTQPIHSLLPLLLALPGCSQAPSRPDSGGVPRFRQEEEGKIRA